MQAIIWATVIVTGGFILIQVFAAPLMGAFSSDEDLIRIGPYLNDPKYVTPGDPSHPVVTHPPPLLRIERNLVCITGIRFNRFDRNCDCSGCETT